MNYRNRGKIEIIRSDSKKCYSFVLTLNEKEENEISSVPTFYFERVPHNDDVEDKIWCCYLLLTKEKAIYKMYSSNAKLEHVVDKGLEELFNLYCEKVNIYSERVSMIHDVLKGVYDEEVNNINEENK